MRKTLLLLLVALVAPAALASPAAAQNREHQQLAADTRILQEQTQQLAITLAALNQALVEAVKAMNSRLDAASDVTRKGFADQKLLIDSLAENVRVIRERSDDTNVRIASLREELEALRATVQALQQPVVPPAGEPGAAVDPSLVPPPPDPAAPPVAPPAAVAGLSPTRLYETARADYFAGQWTSAVTGFEAFLRAFPRSELADDAQFHIGETEFAQSRWEEAIAAYNQVIQSYPGTNSVPDAYYKRGLAQERLGDVEAARASWEEVSKTFPDSDAGRLATQNLDRLKRQRP